MEKKVGKTVSMKVVVGEPKEYKPEDMSDKEVLEWGRKESSVAKSKSEVRERLATAFVKLEDENIPVLVCRLHPKFYQQIRQHCYEEFDPETKIAKMRTGFVGEMWNAEFWVDRNLKVNEVEVIGQIE